MQAEHGRPSSSVSEARRVENIFFSILNVSKCPNNSEG